MGRIVWTATETRVIQELIKCDSQTRPLGRLVTLPDAFYHRACPIISYVTWGVLGVASLLLVICFYLKSISPHFYAKNFHPVTCHTLASRWAAEKAICSCGALCWQTTTCVEVDVRFYTNEGREIDAKLYENIQNLLDRDTCSYHPPCDISEVMVKLKIQKYEEQYGREGANFTCQYNKRFPWEVVHSVSTVGDVTVRHMIAWPCLMAAISLLGFTVTSLIFGFKPYVCNLEPPYGVAIEAKRRENEKSDARIYRKFYEMQGMPVPV